MKKARKIATMALAAVLLLTCCPAAVSASGEVFQETFGTIAGGAPDQTWMIYQDTVPQYVKLDDENGYLELPASKITYTTVTGLEIGTTYEFVARLKAPVGFGIQLTEPSTYYAFPGTSADAWKTVIHRFTATATSTTLYLRRYDTTITEGVHCWDDITITALSEDEARNLVLNGGMEQTEGTMPLGYTVTQGELTKSTTEQAYSGTKSLELGTSNIVSFVITVPEAGNYKAVVKFKGCTMNLAVGSRISGAVGQWARDTWQEYSWDLPELAAQNYTIQLTNLSSRTNYIDDIQITKDDQSYGSFFKKVSAPAQTSKFAFVRMNTLTEARAAAADLVFKCRYAGTDDITDAKIVVASYQQVGGVSQLLGVTISDKTLYEAGTGVAANTKEYSTTDTITIPEGTTVMKGFLWNMSALTPFLVRSATTLTD